MAKITKNLRSKKTNTFNDCDYWDKMTPEEQAWYKTVLADMYGGTPLPGSTKEERSASYLRNNALRRDLLNQQMTVSIPPWAHEISAQDLLDRDTSTASIEDALIDQIDAEREQKITPLVTVEATSTPVKINVRKRTCKD